MRDADRLPEALKKRLVAYYEERIQRSGSNLMFGEQVPFLLVDLLGTSRVSAERIMLPWALLYAHSLLLDDLLDQPDRMDPIDVILSQILLDRAVSGFRDSVGTDPAIWNSFERYRQESLNAMVHEIQQSRRPTTVDAAGQLTYQGYKSAVAKFCAAALVYVEQQRALSATEEDALEGICVAVQLLDDLQDIAEDRAANRYNYILHRASRWLGDNCIVDFDPPSEGAVVEPIAYRLALILSRAVQSSWNLAQGHLAKALAVLAPPSVSCTCHLLQALAQNCRQSEQGMATHTELLQRLYAQGSIEIYVDESGFVCARIDEVAKPAVDAAIRLLKHGPRAAN